MLKLVHKKTGKPVKEGQVIADFRGDEAVFLHGTEPSHPGSTGRAYVRPVDSDPESSGFGFYPSVFDLEWRDQ